MIIWVIQGNLLSLYTEFDYLPSVAVNLMKTLQCRSLKRSLYILYIRSFNFL